MTMKRTNIVILLLILVSNTPVAKSEISMTRNPADVALGANSALVYVNIYGVIDNGDAEKLSAYIDNLRKKIDHPISIIAKLNSAGGNVDASLQIGKMFRQHKALAEVGGNSICASACVFILAGAIGRIVEGKVLIHRPYDPNDQITNPEKQKEKYQLLKATIAKYLNSVNVPVRLYDDMLRISPSGAKTLSKTELESYSLSGNDPYFSEATAVSIAQKLGISREEYIRREVLAREVCDSMDLPENLGSPVWKTWAECHNRIMGHK